MAGSDGVVPLLERHPELVVLMLTVYDEERDVFESICNGARGYLWPNLVRFTTSRVEIWIEQVNSGQVRYYLLPAVEPASSSLDGLFDRTAFLP